MVNAIADFTSKHKRQAHEITVNARSGRVFVLRELRGSEQMVTDSSGTTEPLAIMYRRIAGGLVSIDGDPTPMLNKPKDYQSLLDCIESSELDDLLNAYQDLMPRGEELKKEPEGGEPNDSQTLPSPESPTPTPSE